MAAGMAKTLDVNSRSAHQYRMERGHNWRVPILFQKTLARRKAQRQFQD